MRRRSTPKVTSPFRTAGDGTDSFRADSGRAASSQPYRTPPAAPTAAEIRSGLDQKPACAGSGDGGERSSGGGGGRVSASSGRLFAECQTLATSRPIRGLGYGYGETESHRLCLIPGVQGNSSLGQFRSLHNRGDRRQNRNQGNDSWTHAPGTPRRQVRAPHPSGNEGSPRL